MRDFTLTERGSVLFMMSDGTEFELEHVKLIGEDVEYELSRDVLQEVVACWLAVQAKNGD